MLASIVGVTVFIAVLDALVFRSSLPPYYVSFYTSQLLPRMFATCLSAVKEEVIYRLVLMTVLVMAMTLVRGRKLTPAWFIAVIVAAQFANVGGIVFAAPLYGTLRFWLVGSVWGWLYWRHGWLSALTGHAATHLLLDPALLVLLSRG